MAKLLVLDDDRVCASSLARLLAGEGHEVAWLTSGEDALGVADRPDLFICDWILKNGLSGVDVARSLSARWPQMRVVFITGLPAEQLRREARDLPILDVMEKPLPLDDLFAMIDRFVTHKDMEPV